MEKEKLNNRIKGSLIGGAIRDALGYPVEFLSWGKIMNKYGATGITRYDRQSENSIDKGLALVSDDTQMILYTACGILNAKNNDTAIIPAICEAYIEWLLTQIRKKNEGFEQCWISKLQEMNSCRAPGNTCINSLMDLMNGYKPCNDSKGCGGVMRIAPIPLYGTVANRMNISKVCKLAAEASELTHQHPLGYIPSAFIAYLIYRLALDENPTRESYTTYIKEALFLSQITFLSIMMQLVNSYCWWIEQYFTQITQTMMLKILRTI